MTNPTRSYSIIIGKLSLWIGFDIPIAVAATISTADMTNSFIQLDTKADNMLIDKHLNVLELKAINRCITWHM